MRHNSIWYYEGRCEGYYLAFFQSLLDGYLFWLLNDGTRAIAHMSTVYCCRQSAARVPLSISSAVYVLNLSIPGKVPGAGGGISRAGAAVPARLTPRLWRSLGSWGLRGSSRTRFYTAHLLPPSSSMLAWPTEYCSRHNLHTHTHTHRTAACIALVITAQVRKLNNFWVSLYIINMRCYVLFLLYLKVEATVKE